MLPDTTNSSGGVKANQAGAISDAKDWAKDGRTVPAPPLVTPCYGKSALFDSTALEDHLEARELCLACPKLIPCAKHLLAVKIGAEYGGAPEGTWAGQLFGKERTGDRRSRSRVAADDYRYSDEQAHECYAAWRKGHKDDWTKTGARVWKARQKRAERAARKDVA